jgi:hypothetical protein
MRTPRGRPVSHCLFIDPVKQGGDKRSSLYRLNEKTVKLLLEPFPEPVPAGAMLIARQAAYKAIRLRSFELQVLIGQIQPPASTDHLYLSFSNSLTKDLEALHRMARESSPPERVPSLHEYLEALKSNKIIPVQAEAGGE